MMPKVLGLHTCVHTNMHTAKNKVEVRATERPLGGDGKDTLSSIKREAAVGMSAERCFRPGEREVQRP